MKVEGRSLSTIGKGIKYTYYLFIYKFYTKYNYNVS